MYGRGVAVSKSDFATYAFALLALSAAAAAARRSTARSSCTSRTTRKSAARSARVAARARPVAARLRDLARAFPTAITTAHNGCLHLEVEVLGRVGARGGAGHAASTRSKRRPAILTELYALRKTYAATRSRVAGIGSPTLVVGLIEGGINTNVVPDKVTFRIDRRIIPEENRGRRRSGADAADRRARAASGRASACDVRRILLAVPFVPIAGPGEARRRDRAPRDARSSASDAAVARRADLHGRAASTRPPAFRRCSTAPGRARSLEANGHRADEKLRLDDLHRATEVVALALADLIAAPAGATRRPA